jgi:hypothetical protein
MYGYAKVPKYFGCLSLSSSAVVEPYGTSVSVGASTSNILSAFHFAWYFFSMATKVSRFVVWGLVSTQPQEDCPEQTFSSFKVFLELLLGSNRSMVSPPAAILDRGLRAMRKPQRMSRQDAANLSYSGSQEHESMSQLVGLVAGPLSFESAID